jgi:S1-C subfamily serine protease
MVLVPAASADVKKSVVKIFTVSSTPSYYQPWQMNGQSAESGSGSIISGNRILTNAHVVSNAMFIQVRKYGEAERYVAEVLAVDHDCDLALLQVKDKSFFNNTWPISIGSLPKQGDPVNVYGYPTGGDELSRTKGVVSRIEIGIYSHSYKSHLDIQIDAAINPGNSGGPVIKDDAIVGVAFQNLHNSNNIGYAIPTDVINHFLNGFKDGKYRGFPMTGIWWETMENEPLRTMLGMSKDQSGILVTRAVYDSTAYDALKEDDVILSIDGVNIANDGTVPLRGDSNVRVRYTYLLDSKYVGDKARIKVIRDKKTMTLDVMLKGGKDLVPSMEYDVKPTYYIFGGLVVTRLTGNYLHEWNDLNKSPIDFQEDLFLKYKTPEKQEVVVLIQVLADGSNLGYHDINNTAVDEVNGEKIRDIEDFVDKVENNKGKYLIIRLSDDTRIVLDYDRSRKATAGILARYQIQNRMSQDLADKINISTAGDALDIFNLK